MSVQEEYVAPTLQKGKNMRVPTVSPWSKPVKRRPPPAVRHPKNLKQVESPSAANEIEQHEEKIIVLQLKVLRLVRTLESQRFLSRRAETKDIKFYTAFSSYSILICLYRFLEPLLSVNP